MSTLVLDLKADDMMIINGAPIRVRNKTRLELNAHARFLFGKQIMPPGAATTPGRRIYYAAQTAYIGDASERPPAREEMRALCAEFAAHTTSKLAVGILNDAMRAIDEDRCYDALKLVRTIIRHEDAVLGLRPAREREGAGAAAGAGAEAGAWGA
ncbi:MAG: flagellar biosynthesis repressor FlbT [Janthinobacterium lividum]